MEFQPVVGNPVHGPSLPENLVVREDVLPYMVSPPLGRTSSAQPQDHPNWSKILFPEVQPIKKFKLRFIPPTHRDEKLFGVCQKSAVEGELQILDLTLVGFFLGKRPSFSFVKSALLRQWKLHGNVEIIQLLQGGYAFRFSNLKDRDGILEGAVFFVGGQPMFIRKWERSIHTGGILGLRRVPLWVSLPGLPLHLWGEEALSSVCSVLGNPLYTDRNTAMKSRLMFARVCVEFMGDQPLLESINIEDELGMLYEQKVTYDWKPPHCLSCGVFGHAECRVQRMEMESEMEENPTKQTTNDTAGRKMMDEFKEHSEIGQENDGDLRLNKTSPNQEEDNGWRKVRARKRRPSGSGCGSGSGSPILGRKVPASQPVQTDTRSVSTPHWLEQSSKGQKVLQPDLSPNRKDNFEF